MNQAPASRSRTFSRSMSATGRILRRQLWLWPLCAAVALSVVAWVVHRSVESAVKQKLGEELKTILRSELAALEIWLDTREAFVHALSIAPVTRPLVEAQVELAHDETVTDADLLRSEPLTKLRGHLAMFLGPLGYNGFLVFDTDRRVIAGNTDQTVGRSGLAGYDELLDVALTGEVTVSQPFRSAMLLPDESGNLKAGQPTMFAAAPVLDEEGNIIAVLALRMRPETDFTRILSVARSGESGETYAFDERGMLLSESRFDAELKQIGLIPDNKDARSILNVQIRDPQVDMTLGQRPKTPRDEQPLTYMAEQAIAGNNGFDVDGYRDYRGVPVIGAWEWLPKYGFGVTTEVTAAEAYRPLYILRTAFWSLFALLVVCAGAVFVFMRIAAKQQLSARRAVFEAKQLGQYQLDEKIGEGAMGVVYRAHHAMMQRDTAVKLLSAEKTTDAAIARFEREVQLTSRLNHPNTIELYDFGRTPEGVFYYAMEYLDGISLDHLVSEHGALPEGRVIHILRQICGSLAEAHGIGLIHRDIKPANIMLNQRGGRSDVVKVLDFGLVKAVDAEREKVLTAAGALTGTPLYLSPEGIERPGEVDGRSDLYAVGAVGYYLLTGQTVFDGDSVVEVCMQQVNADPIPPSDRAHTTFASSVESLIMMCLAKNPGDRPQQAAILEDALGVCAAKAPWTREQADQWWQDHNIERNIAAPHTPTDAGQVDATTIFDQPTT